MTKEEIKNKVYNSCPDDHRCETELTRWSVLEQVGEDTAKIIPCPCAEKVERHYRYDRAGIGQEFWAFNFSKLDKEFDKKIIDNYVNVFLQKTEDCIKNKVCLWFHGSSGSGTTLVAILVLKHILDSGFKGKIISANQIISLLYSQRISELDEYDFLVIDSVDNIQRDSSAVKRFSLVASEFIDTKSIIFTSAIPVSKLTNDYDIDFINRVDNVPSVKFKDINFRENISSRFDAVKEKR